LVARRPSTKAYGDERRIIAFRAAGDVGRILTVSHVTALDLRLFR
jgi:hypothetical protein